MKKKMEHQQKNTNKYYFTSVYFLSNHLFGHKSGEGTLKYPKIYAYIFFNIDARMMKFEKKK